VGEGGVIESCVTCTFTFCAPKILFCISANLRRNPLVVLGGQEKGQLPHHSKMPKNKDAIARTEVDNIKQFKLHT
jgi:hypothetical protein